MDKSKFKISEPTDEEIEKTIQKIKDQDGVVLSKDDAIQYTKLYEEMKQWFMMENNLETPDSIAGETSDAVQESIKTSYGLEIKEDLAQDIVDKSLGEVISRGKERIGKELKGIVANYKR